MSDANIKQALAFANCLYQPHDIVEINTSRDVHSDHPTSIWTTIEKLEEHWVQARIYATKVCMGMNPRKGRFCRTNKSVQCARCLFVQIKIGRSYAMRKISEAGIPCPTLITESSDGLTLFWKLNEPIVDMQHWANIQNYLRLLLISEEGSAEPNCVVQLPGTTHGTLDSTVKCKILSGGTGKSYAIQELISDDIHLEEQDYDQVHRTRDFSAVEICLISSTLPYAHDEQRQRTIFYNAAYLMNGEGLEKNDVINILLDSNYYYGEPLEESEVRELVDEVEANAPDDYGDTEDGGPGDRAGRLKTALTLRGWSDAEISDLATAHSYSGFYGEDEITAEGNRCYLNATLNASLAKSYQYNDDKEAYEKHYKAAIEWLISAVENGFRDLFDFEKRPEFKILEDSREYQKILRFLRNCWGPEIAALDSRMLRALGHRIERSKQLLVKAE